MKLILTIALGLAAAGPTIATFAQTPAQPADRQTRHAKVDANGDGVIDRSEAATRPRLAARFDQLDADKDGRITAAERPQRGMRHGRGDRGARMAQLDSNKDGAIDRAEAAKSPKLSERFDRLDANRDGRIAADERPRGTGGGRMARLDADKDGRLTRQELVGKQRVLQRFAAIDRSGDGALSREELRNYRKAQRGQRDTSRQQK